MEGVDPMVGEGKWVKISGSGELDDPTDPLTAVTKLEFGVSKFEWTINNGFCPEVVDSMIIDMRPIQQTNGFSPNGDGINDVFVIRGIENARGNRLVVFNNWGDVIYQANDYQNDWEGKTNNGADLPSDTYYFILTIPEVGEYSGYLILKR